MKNQNPAEFFDPLIKDTISKLYAPKTEEKDVEQLESDTVEKKKVFLEYRGIVSEKFKISMMKCNAPVKIACHH